MQVTVTPGHLVDAAKATRATGTALGAAVRAVEGAVGPLGRTWSGSASEAFGRHQTNWNTAASGLVATLAELSALIDTAHGNYTAAATTNASIWASARGSEGIELETDDVRAAVTALLPVADGLTTAWTTLAAALAPSAGMAGDDAAGAGFAGDHDRMAATTWQAWRTAIVMLDGIVGGLVATGNNVIRAEHKSMPNPSGAPADVITSYPIAVPAPATPPSAAGAGAPTSWQRLAPIVSTYWPRADADTLRAVQRPWLTSKEAVLDAAGRATSVIDGLANANPDRAVQDLRTFTTSTLSADRERGLFGVLATAGGRMAEACELLAGATDDTRQRMSDEIARIMGGGEWYHDVADLVNGITRGASTVVAEAGDLMMLDLSLSTLARQHEDLVAQIRGEISPEAADHLARFATALQPPKAADAYTRAAGTSSTAARSEVDRAALIGELVDRGEKVSPAEVLAIGRAPDGKIVWMERGGEKAGLSHILRARRISDFMGVGVAPVDIPGIAVTAVVQGTAMGRIGRDGIVYETDIGGGARGKVVVIVGTNGFIVSAYPYNGKSKIKPMGGG